jgi:3-hydroxyisobutyrate dehydrogenase-like beta-hydroxyacid dehydrogenase
MSANVTVIGIGAMGGGMARSLLNSNETKTLLGYDRNATLCHSFFEESLNARKAASDTPPSALDQAISQETTACVLVLVNEAQCESVCFGTDEPNLSTLMPPNSCVILCSTVTGKRD